MAGLVHTLIHSIVALALAAGLVVFAYLGLVYRELGWVVTGRARIQLDIFENEIEPRLGIERRHGALLFGLIAYSWLAAFVAVTVLEVVANVPEMAPGVVQLVVFIGVEIVVGAYLLPYLLLARTRGRWVLGILPLVRLVTWIAWPFAAVIEFGISLAHLFEEPGAAPAEEQALEALVEAAQEEGILEKDEARLIEQVVEFSDKRISEVMTPRPDVVAIAASATVEQLRQVIVENKFSRLPVYEASLDEIVGIVSARDVLAVPEGEAARRTVRELMRPALFVPETKLGSELLREMRHKNQAMAIVIDEYGLVAGIVTIEDLVEEIVGETGPEGRAPSPDVVRESSDSLLLRGSVRLEKLQDLFGLELDREENGATTVGGLLNGLLGHVPRSGEVIDYDGLRFEVLEANQRKVLRLRARHLPRREHAAAASSG
jgi:CBS domain containing-hemolysin-like protein